MYWTECKQPGPHWHGTHTCRSLLALDAVDEHYLVPVGEGTIIEVDAAVDWVLDRDLSITYAAVSWPKRKQDQWKAARRDSIRTALRAAAGEKP